YPLALHRLVQGWPPPKTGGEIVHDAWPPGNPRAADQGGSIRLPLNLRCKSEISRTGAGHFLIVGHCCITRALDKMNDLNLNEITGRGRGDSAEGTDNYSRGHRLTHASSPRPPRVEARRSPEDEFSGTPGREAKAFPRPRAAAPREFQAAAHFLPERDGSPPSPVLRAG